jgi:hypothetical protein
VRRDAPYSVGDGVVVISELAVEQGEQFGENQR